MKTLFAKSALIGAGLAAGSLAALALAVTVGTIKTWTSGETLTASDLNTTISSLKTAIEGIPNWTKSGSDAIYTDGKIGVGITAPVAPIHVAPDISNSGTTSFKNGSNVVHADNQSLADGATAYVRLEVVGDGYHFGTLRNSNDDVDFLFLREVTSSGSHSERLRLTNGGDVKATGKFLAYTGTNAVPVTTDSTQQLIQTGRACEATGTSGAANVSFSPAFSSAPRIVATVDINGYGTTATTAYVNNSTVTPSSAAVQIQGGSGDSNIQCVQWIAIGPK